MFHIMRLFDEMMMWKTEYIIFILSSYWKYYIHTIVLLKILYSYYCLTEDIIFILLSYWRYYIHTIVSLKILYSYYCLTALFFIEYSNCQDSIVSCWHNKRNETFECNCNWYWYQVTMTDDLGWRLWLLSNYSRTPKEAYSVN